MDSLKVTDAASEAVAIAPRVKLSDIEAAIAARFDSTAAELVSGLIPGLYAPDATEAHALGQLRILSVCILVMKNGFTIIGKSAPASAQNFSGDLGKQYAYEDAVRQLWPLMGYALRDRLANG